MKMNIGILGTGRMAVRLARLFAECGSEVTLGSRTPERAKRITQGLGLTSIRPGSYEAAADAAVVLPAMFLRDGMLDTLEPLRARFDGKLWVDITNRRTIWRALVSCGVRQTTKATPITN